ncbi:ABC transporter substrate-binding protein [Bosea sp. 685]|uniref:ABC transporter substrate-binding protein n=1 Tax=Bosea sp. 685 TaxID=3080057 RepID=UPI002892E46F|nr:ABC transporter substrate-binding protein [Bosea sp. 685]WNJ88863.1 ABC transporter substrate-binding protein [Bosea sp. 685]
MSRIASAGIASTAVAATIAATLIAAPAAAQTTITFAGYTGLYQDLYTKAVIEPFMTANPDIKVVYFAPGNSAAILGTLRAQKSAPQIDVAMMDISIAKAGSDENLFDPIDEKVTAHVKDLYPQALMPGVNLAGMTFDSLVLVYDKTILKEPPKSWRALWAPAVDRKVALHGAPDILGIALTVVMEKIAGGTDWNHNLDKGVKEMETLAPHVMTWDPKPDLWGMVMSQQAAIGAGYNARSQVFADQPGSVLAASIPDEGTLFQINAVTLVKNAPQPAAARKLVDYMLSPVAQKAFAEAMFYGPTNKKAELSPEAAKRIRPADMSKVIDVDWLELAKIRDKLTQDWRRRVIPLSK